MKTLNKKKILLVHPLGYQADKANSDIARVANINPPIGLLSIASYLTEKNIKADIIDAYVHPHSDTLIRDYLLTEKPAYIGFSCTTSSFNDGVRIAAMAKSIWPKIKTIFGGAHVSALKDTIIDLFPIIDIVVVGEGEETLVDIIQFETQELEKIPGIVYKTAAKESLFTGQRIKQLDLDTLPFPAYDRLHGYPQAYRLPIFNYPKGPGGTCISSRGCPYACSYCDRSVFRRTFRFNSAAYLYTHLKYLRERFHIRHVSFYDDQFTFNRQRVMEFTNLMIAKPLGMTFNCVVRAEHVDFELLKQMKKAGCWLVSLGIETGDPNLLAQHRQNADLELIADCIQLIKKAKIKAKGLLMLGLPGETEKSIRKSMAYVYSLPLDDFNLSKFTPFPGSPLYQNISKFGRFDEDWEKMDCMNFQFVPSGIPKKRLEELFIHFYKRHFMQPKTLLNFTKMIWQSPESWERFFKNSIGFFRFIRSNQRHVSSKKP